MADEKPIIVIKKKGGHGGHHGGAWKVAYADFVTAMMAFFMVMWLVNSAEVQTKQSIASYFRRPGLFSQGSGTPLMIGESGILNDSYSPNKGHPAKDSNVKSDNKIKPKTPPPKDAVDQKRENPNGLPEQKAGKGGKVQGNDLPFLSLGNDLKDKGAKGEKGESLAQQQEAFEKAAEQIKKQLADSPQLRELLGIVDVKVDADGLNIEIMDTEKSSMFAPGSARILPTAREDFLALAGILNKLPNKIDILGHTDAKPFSARNYGYSNWELSSDRANAARKLLEEGGVSSERITGIVGKADTTLRDPEHPFAPANRRITLKMRFNTSAEVDLSKDPNALEKMFSNPALTDTPTGAEIPATTSSGSVEGSESPPQAADSSEAETTEATPEASPEPKVSKLPQGFVPKKKIQAQSQTNTVPLPDIEPPKDNPSYIPKDKIFGDRPVIGGSSPFSTP